MNIKKNKSLNIVTQAFYGNRVATEVKPENVNRFILGYLHDFPIDYPIDRTIVKVPNTKNIVIVYNKHKEDEWKERKEKVLKEENYVIKPLAVIPEENIEIYSRCIVCRMNKDGELESLHRNDYKKFMKYLAE